MASEGGLVGLRHLERSAMATLSSGPGVSAVGGVFPRVQPGSSRDRSASAGNGIQPDPGRWTAGTGDPDSGIGLQMVNGKAEAGVADRADLQGTAAGAYQ